MPKYTLTARDEWGRYLSRSIEPLDVATLEHAYDELETIANISLECDDIIAEIGHPDVDLLHRLRRDLERALDSLPDPEIRNKHRVGDALETVATSLTLIVTPIMESRNIEEALTEEQATREAIRRLSLDELRRLRESARRTLTPLSELIRARKAVEAGENATHPPDHSVLLRLWIRAKYNLGRLSSSLGLPDGSESREAPGEPEPESHRSRDSFMWLGEKEDE